MHMHIQHSMHAMKTERVTVLASPEFKAFLNTEAAREGVSVSALVRARCERPAESAEAELAELAAELRSAVRGAKRSLKAGLDEANAVLEELRAKREAPRAKARAA